MLVLLLASQQPVLRTVAGDAPQSSARTLACTSTHSARGTSSYDARAINVKVGMTQTIANRIWRHLDLRRLEPLDSITYLHVVRISVTVEEAIHRSFVLLAHHVLLEACNPALIEWCSTVVVFGGCLEHGRSAGARVTRCVRENCRE